MTRRSALVLAAAIPLLAATIVGQAPQGPPPAARTGTGLVSGEVVDATGQPVGDALVNVVGRGGAIDRVITDPRGRFVFRSMPSGAFVLAASRPGYFGGGIGQIDPTAAGRPFELLDGQQVTGVTLRVWKGGAIAGTVSDDAGAPLAGVAVFAVRRALLGGKWTMSAGPTTTTDDRGQYRIDGLVPGSYAVAARPDTDLETPLLLSMLAANPAVSADIMAAAMAAGVPGPQLDAGARNYSAWVSGPAESRLIDIAAGADGVKVDFKLTRSSLVKVSGVIAQPEAAADGVSLQLVRADAKGALDPIEIATTACDEEGHFEFAGVMPGHYAIRARPLPPPVQPAPNPPPGAPQPSSTAAWSGSTTIDVGNENLTGVSVPLQRGVALTGRVVFEGASPRPAPAQLAQMTFRLDPIDQPVVQGAPFWRGEADAEGRFRSMAVPAGEYLLRILTPPPRWTPQSAVAAGRDILDAPITIGDRPVDDLVITFSDRPLAGVTGLVNASDGTSATDATVVLFPTDRGLWRDSTPQARRLRLTRPTASGRYGVGAVPAGEYFVAAIAGELPAEWQDPARLELMSARASRVQIGAVPSPPIELTVMPAIAVPAASATPARSGKVAPGKATPAAKKSSAKSAPTKVAPADPDRSAAVSGTVIDGTSRKPVANATVLIAGTDVGVLRVTSTTAQGTFSFDALPAGHFLVGARTPSHLVAVHGAAQPGRPGTTIEVAAGQRVSNLSLSLVRGGVLTGRVLDDGDRPVAGARVRVFQHRATGVEVSFNGEAGDPVVITTDDRGVYRVFNLPRGEYSVAVQARGVAAGDVRRLTAADIDGTAAPAPLAQPQNGMAVAYASVYFPGTPVPGDAQGISIGPGETRANVDIHTPLARLVRVEGTLTDGDRALPANVQITLRPRGMNASGALLTNLTTRPGPNGRFTFANVPPGDYTVLARTQPPPPIQDRPLGGQDQAPAAAVRWAMTDVTVAGENISDVALTMQTALTVSGRVQIEGLTRLPANLPLIRVGVRATPGSNVPNPTELSPLDKDGHFTIRGLVPGQYRVYVQVPNSDIIQVPEWFATTAVIDGVSGDALDVPFDVGPARPIADLVITLTDDTQEVDGTVRDSSGQPLRDCAVIIFPVDRRFWFQQSRRVALRTSARDGKFVFGMSAALPAGEYYLATVRESRPAEQVDVQVLDELVKGAARVMLASGDTRTHDLVVK